MPNLSPFFIYWHVRTQDLHSFPTRRSSDLWRYLRRGWPWLEQPHCQVLEGWKVHQSLGKDRIRAGRIPDRKSTRLNSSHVAISYAVFCLKKKITKCLRIEWKLFLRAHNK